MVCQVKAIANEHTRPHRRRFPSSRGHLKPVDFSMRTGPPLPASRTERTHRRSPHGLPDEGHHEHARPHRRRFPSARGPLTPSISQGGLVGLSRPVVLAGPRSVEQNKPIASSQTKPTRPFPAFRRSARPPLEHARPHRRRFPSSRGRLTQAISQWDRSAFPGQSCWPLPAQSYRTNPSPISPWSAR
jgi:hypothetical protein